MKPTSIIALFVLLAFGILTANAQTAINVVTVNVGSISFVPTSPADPSWSWDLETDTPNTYQTLSVPWYRYGGWRTNNQAHSGTYSLWLSGTFPLAEFDAGVGNSTADFDFDIGTLDFWVRWTGAWAGGQIISLKNEDGSQANIYLQNKATEGQFNLYYHEAAYYVTVSGLTADTWHNIVAKWRSASAPYLSCSLDGGTAATKSDTPPASEDADERQVLVGNDTATVWTYWLDDIKIWKEWR